MRPRRSPFDVDCLFSGFGLFDAFNVEQRQVQVIEGIEYTGQGGLILQVGVHALRFIEFIAGTKVDEIWAIQTQLGNPGKGGLRVATSMMLRLANGGGGSITCNYLNPPAFGLWGNEMVRIFGTEGFIESTNGGAQTRLVLNGEDRGSLDIADPSQRYLDLYLASLPGPSLMPLALEDELHPTRVLIRARADALARSRHRAQRP